jgi:DNA-binding GntR family transcriptional regulator
MNNGLYKLEQYLLENQNTFQNTGLRLRDLAYKRLYDALRNVELDPGEPLPEIQLSKILGISRTPVREALQQLAMDGLIQMIQGRAVTISMRSAQEVFDALHVRELLEPQALKLCALAMPPDMIQKLLHITDQMERAARACDRVGWFRADREWHELLSDACPNKLLGQMVMQVRNRMYHRGASEHVSDQYLIEGTHEHRQIVEAIAAHDGDLAEQLTLSHLRELRENIFKRFGG